MEASPCLPPTDRHIVRNSLNLTDHYHGPCTLLALCNEFYDTLVSVQWMQAPGSVKDESQRSKGLNRPAISDTTRGLLDQVCLEAGVEDSVDLQAGPAPVQLPPKQFLLIAQTKFFQQADYATDLFVQSCYRSNVERIYNKPFTLADEAWAICFNVIILLVLGPESLTQYCDPQTTSQLIQPYLLTVRSALSNPRILTVAKLVNVQALALLVSTICIITMHISLLQ